MSAITHRQASGSLEAPDVRWVAWRRVLLACAVVSAPLYIGLDVVSALLYDGYSYKDQTISELSAIGAETRPLWIPLGFLYAGLLIAGAFGIWKSAGEVRSLRVVAVLVGIVGVVGVVAWPFAPMHQREVLAAGGGTLSDTLHLVLGGVDTILFFLMMGFGAWALGKSFRAYTIATILLALVFGGLTAMESPDVADNEPTPWLGIWERIAVLGPMIWIAVLGFALLRAWSSVAADEREPSVELPLHGAGV